MVEIDFWKPKTRPLSLWHVASNDSVWKPRVDCPSAMPKLVPKKTHKYMLRKVLYINFRITLTCFSSSYTITKYTNDQLCKIIILRLKLCIFSPNIKIAPQILTVIIETLQRISLRFSNANGNKNFIHRPPGGLLKIYQYYFDADRTWKTRHWHSYFRFRFAATKFPDLDH